MAINVLLLKLITGEEVLAEITNETTELDFEDDEVVIKNPVRIVIMPGNDPKNPSIGFAPFALWSDQKEFVIQKSHIITIMTPQTDFVNNYNQQFGGIIVPNSNLIVP